MAHVTRTRHTFRKTLRRRVVRELEDRWKEAIDDPGVSVEDLFDLLRRLIRIPPDAIRGLGEGRAQEDLRALPHRFLDSLEHWIGPHANEADRRAALCEAVLCLEPLCKIVLACTNPAGWSRLQSLRHPNTGQRRWATLHDYLYALGLTVPLGTGAAANASASEEGKRGVKRSTPPRLGESFTWLRDHYREFEPLYKNLRRLRNIMVHQAPQLSETDCMVGIRHAFLAMLYIVYRERERLSEALATIGQVIFNRKRRRYLRELVQASAPLCDKTVPLNATQEGPQTRGHAEVPIDKLISRLRRLLLVAPPGAGKTTTLRYVAARLAHGILSDRYSELPCPLYLELRRCAPERPLEDLLARAAGSEIDLLRKQIARGRWLLLLDGLNEVPASYQEDVKRAIEEIVSSGQHVRLVLATRPGVSNSFRLPVYRLNPLTDTQKSRFISLHLSAEDSARLEARLREDPALWGLAQNPMNLEMLLELMTRPDESRLQNKADLVGAFLGRLLRRESEKTRQVSIEKKKALLSELALDLLHKGQMVISPRYFVERVGAAADRLHARLDAWDFLEEVLDNHLMVQNREDETGLAFAHETFRDYFAAVALLDRIGQGFHELRRILKDPRWGQVIVMLYGLLDPPPQNHLLDLLMREDLPLAAECVASELHPDAERLQRVSEQAERVFLTPSIELEHLMLVFRSMLAVGRIDRIIRFLRDEVPQWAVEGVAVGSLLPAVEVRQCSAATVLEILSALWPIDTVADALVRYLERRGVKPIAADRQNALRILHDTASQAVPLDWFRRFVQWCLCHGLVATEEIFGFGTRLLQTASVDAVERWRTAFGEESGISVREYIGLLLRKGQVQRAAALVAADSTSDPQIIVAVANALLEHGDGKRAAQLLAARGLSDAIPPQVLIASMVQHGQIDEAVDCIKVFNVREPDVLATVAGALVENRRWSRLATWLREEGVRRALMPDGIREMIRKGDWGAAAHQVLDLHKGDPVVGLALVHEMLASGWPELAALWLDVFEVYIPDIEAEIAATLARQGKWDRLVPWLARRELAKHGPERLFEDAVRPHVIERVLACLKRFLSADPVPFSACRDIVRMLQLWDVSDDLLATCLAETLRTMSPNVATEIIDLLIDMRKWEVAGQVARACDLENALRPEEILLGLLREGQWAAAEEWARACEPDIGVHVRCIKEMIASDAPGPALLWIRDFGLAGVIDPTPLFHLLFARASRRVAPWHISWGDQASESARHHATTGRSDGAIRNRGQGTDGDAYFPGDSYLSVFAEAARVVRDSQLLDYANHGAIMEWFARDCDPVGGVAWFRAFAGGDSDLAEKAIRKAIELDQAPVVCWWAMTLPVQDRRVQVAVVRYLLDRDFGPVVILTSRYYGRWWKRIPYVAACGYPTMYVPALVRKWKLESDFPFQATAERLLSRGEIEAAYEWVDTFAGKGDQLVARVVSELAMRRMCSHARRLAIKTGLANNEALTRVAECFLRKGDWRTAAIFVRKNGLRAPELLCAVAQRLVRRVFALPRVSDSRFGHVPVRLARRRQIRAATRAAEWIRDFHLESHFPPHDLIERALACGYGDAAVCWIQLFGAEERFSPDVVVPRLLESGDWRAAAAYLRCRPAADSRLAESLVRCVLERGDTRTAARYVAEFSVRTPDLLVELVRRMLKQKRWNAAAALVRTYGLTSLLPPEQMARNLLERGHWYGAATWVRRFKLQDVGIFRELYRALIRDGGRFRRGGGRIQALIYLAQLMRFLGVAENATDVCEGVIRELKAMGWYGPARYWAETLSVPGILTPDERAKSEYKVPPTDPRWVPDYRLVCAVEEANYAAWKRRPCSKIRGMLPGPPEGTLRGVITGIARCGYWIAAPGFRDFFSRADVRFAGAPKAGCPVIFTLTARLGPAWSPSVVAGEVRAVRGTTSP